MPLSHHIRPSIFLDYGADAADPADTACEICERGMRFSSQWQFRLGDVMQIAFAFKDVEARRIEAECFVAECIATGSKEYRTTLAFVETPKELRDSLGKVSTRLEFCRHRSQAEPTSL